MTKLFYIFAVAVFLTGCGRISKPEKPKGATYPETYIVKE